MQAPPGDRFPAFPVSWYLFAPSHTLRRGPVSRDIFGRRLVAFRTAAGRLAVLDLRCSHFGADLGGGCVIGESLAARSTNGSMRRMAAAPTSPAPEHPAYGPSGVVSRGRTTRSRLCIQRARSVV